jgi:hypothetical protein
MGNVTYVFNDQKENISKLQQNLFVLLPFKCIKISLKNVNRYIVNLCDSLNSSAQVGQQKDPKPYFSIMILLGKHFS